MQNVTVSDAEETDRDAAQDSSDEVQEVLDLASDSSASEIDSMDGENENYDMNDACDLDIQEHGENPPTWLSSLCLFICFFCSPITC